VFAHSFFFLLAAAFAVWRLVQNFRTLRDLPESTGSAQTAQRAVPPGQSLAFTAVRKSTDYHRLLLLLAPGIALAGIVSLVYTLKTLRIGPFDWGRLRDLIGPAFFVSVGCAITWVVVRHRLTSEKILKNWVCVMGIVTEATWDGLRYRFRDLAGLEHEGGGSEYSGEYYEDMEVPVVYERDNPKNNLPVSALYDEYEVHFNSTEFPAAKADLAER
jgi:hypothetical protein